MLPQDPAGGGDRKSNLQPRGALPSFRRLGPLGARDPRRLSSEPSRTREGRLGRDGRGVKPTGYRFRVPNVTGKAHVLMMSGRTGFRDRASFERVAVGVAVNDIMIIVIIWGLVILLFTVAGSIRSFTRTVAIEAQTASVVRNFLASAVFAGFRNKLGLRTVFFDAFSHRAERNSVECLVAPHAHTGYHDVGVEGTVIEDSLHPRQRTVVRLLTVVEVLADPRIFTFPKNELTEVGLVPKVVREGVSRSMVGHRRVREDFF